jgi:predicted phage tail protein
MKTRAFNLLLAIILVLGASCSAFAAVAVPNPLSPASGASLTSPLTISWSAVTDPSGILGYNWQVSTSSTFPTIALQNSTNVGTTQDTVSGLPNGTYFWRVQAVSGAFVKSAWSAARSFNITGAGAGQPGAPALSPTKGYSTFHPLEVITFNWSPVAGATSYVLQTSKDPSFPVTATASINNIPNNTYSFSTPDEGSYSARVYAVNANGIAGVPSNIINYSVFYNNPIGAPPAPVSPASGATLTLPVQVAWTDVANPQPSGYELQIAKDSGFQ